MKDDKIGEEDFMRFVGNIGDMCSRPDLTYDEEQRGHVFDHFSKDSGEDSELTLEMFTSFFVEKFICVHAISVTDELDLNDATAVGKLEVDDVCEALGEPTTHDSVGLTRLKVKLEKNGTTGWVTLQGNQGTAYLESFTEYSAFVKNMEKAFASAVSKTNKLASFVTQKTAAMKDCQQGPLAEAKAEFAKIGPKVDALHKKINVLKKKVEAGKIQHARRSETEKRMVEEKRERKAAAVILDAINEKVVVARDALAKLQETANPLISAADPTEVENPITIQGSIVSNTEVQAAVVEARTVLKAHEGKVQAASSGPWLDAKTEIAKLGEELSSMEKKVLGFVAAAQAACDAISTAKLGEVSAALRASMSSRKVRVEDLFLELAGSGGTDIKEDVLATHWSTLPNVKLSPEQNRLLFNKVGAAGGVSRRCFFQMLERYVKVVKEIAITTASDVSGGSSIRKLAKGEILEILDGPQTDDVGLSRVRAKTLSDDQVGWVTVKGNQGTPFLADTLKPAFCVCERLTMDDEPHDLKVGEVLEVLQGPRRETVMATVRVRGKTIGGKEQTGWFTLKDRHGKVFAEVGKSCYTTASSIALTDGFNMRDSKVLRKISKGESLVVLEGPLTDEAGGGCIRIKAKALKDDQDGWVTIKGNGGTVYATETGKQYNISASVPLQSSFKSDGAENLCVLEKDMCVELLEGPKDEVSPDVIRLRVRTTSEGHVGWVTLKGENVKPWSPQYRCVASTVMHDSLAVKDSTVTVHELEPGSVVELLEGPQLETGTGVLRMKAKVVVGGVVGWVTIAGNEGKQFLECVLPK